MIRKMGVRVLDLLVGRENYVFALVWAVFLLLGLYRYLTEGDLWLFLGYLSLGTVTIVGYLLGRKHGPVEDDY